MVVQFGVREHAWPGGSFRGFDVPAGTDTRDSAFAYRLVEGRIAERWAIRDDLAMLQQLGALGDRDIGSRSDGTRTSQRRLTA